MSAHSPTVEGLAERYRRLLTEDSQRHGMAAVTEAFVLALARIPAADRALAERAIDLIIAGPGGRMQ